MRSLLPTERLEEIDGRLAVTDVDSHAHGVRYVKFWVDEAPSSPKESRSHAGPAAFKGVSPVQPKTPLSKGQEPSGAAAKHAAAAEAVWLESGYASWPAATYHAPFGQLALHPFVRTQPS